MMTRVPFFPPERYSPVVPVVPTAGMDGAYESARARLKAQSKREPGADPGATRFGATRSRSLLSGGTKPKASSDGRERATTVEVVQGADDDIVDAQGRMTRALLHDATGCRDLSSATVADLHNADLTALASGDLDACPNLVSLDLSFNQLVDIDGDALARGENRVGLLSEVAGHGATSRARRRRSGTRRDRRPRSGRARPAARRAAR